MENWSRIRKDDSKDSVDDFETLTVVPSSTTAPAKSEQEEDQFQAGDQNWDDDDQSLLHPGHAGHGITGVEWIAPKEGLGQVRLSLQIDLTEKEVFVEDVRDRQHTLTDKDCVADDVLRVWTNISRFIIKKLKAGFGVQICGLCTIAFQQERFDLADLPGYFELVKSPVMIMSSLIVKMYNLRTEFSHENCPGLAKTVPLNLAEIGLMSRLPRNKVQGVLTELLQAFARAVVCNKKVEFPFPNIGKLQVKDGKGSMKFYEEFYTRMGYDLPLRYLNPLNSASTDESNNSFEPEEDRVIPGRMTPLRHHIPSEDYRSVFHVREVRSVHDGDLLADPLDNSAKQGKCYKDKRRTSLKTNPLHPNPFSTDSETNFLHHHAKSNASSLFSVDLLPNLKEDYYVWNQSKNCWEDPCGNPVYYVAESLYKFRDTGKFTIDAVNKSEELFRDALYTHHHNICCQVLGVQAVMKHFERRKPIPPETPFSYEEMHGPTRNQTNL